MGSLKGVEVKTLETVLHDIKKGTAVQCYLIHGDEEYLVKDALDKITNLILPGENRDFNLFYIDGESEDIDSICESILTPPLIPGKKIVAVKNSRFFHSKTTLPDLVKKIVKNIDDNTLEAARAFLSFIKTVGWTLEDLKDDGWKKISDDEWTKAIGSNIGKGRGAWLPKMINFCDSRDMKAGRSQEDTQALVDALTGGLPEGNCLIMTADYSVDKRKKLFKAMSDIGIVLGFTRVKNQKMQKKLLKDATEKLLEGSGKKLTPEAFLALERKTGFNIRQFREAVEKLITYTGDRSVITGQDVQDITGRTREDSIFDLTSALSEKNPRKALLTLKELLDQGVHHLMVMTMIIREIRLLIHAKILLRSKNIPSFHPEMDYNQFHKTVYHAVEEYGKGSMLVDQHPYVLYNVFKNSERFSYEELGGYLETLVNVDTALKTTGKNPKLILERLLAEICL